MGSNFSELAFSWLAKALIDLASAEKLAAGTNPILETAVYHCQQAAEKALKGYLIFRESRIQKTHDITALLEFASQFDHEFQDWLAIGDRLTFYGTGFRYPGEIEPLEKEEAEKAIVDTKLLIAIIQNKLTILGS